MHRGKYGLYAAMQIKNVSHVIYANPLTGRLVVPHCPQVRNGLLDISG